MKKSKTPSVGKLLRVLVAGGVALAGTGPLAARAEEAPEKTGKSTDKAATAPKAAEADAAKKKPASAEKEKPKEKEKQADEPGGVKGW
jgi:hypothetical protein